MPPLPPDDPGAGDAGPEDAEGPPGRRGVLALALAVVVGLVAGAAVLLTRGDDGPVDPAADPAADLLVVSTAPVEPLPPELLARGIRRYVAMGDSFSAGPGIAPAQEDSGTALTCGRSTRSYPALIAARGDVRRFVDATCSGASTAAVTDRQLIGADAVVVPPQIRALNGREDLITVSLGANDGDLFATVFAVCAEVVEQSVGGPPDATPCRDAFGEAGVAGLEASATGIRASLAADLEAIRRRSPDAVVVVVGYPRIFPVAGTCEDLLLTDADARWLAGLFNVVVASQEQAARDADVRFVDLRTTEGQAICEEGTWVNGGFTAPGDGIGFHPSADGMARAADRIVEALTP